MDFETDTPQDMEMPTPCPSCSRWVELNDMNTCGTCKELYCNRCLAQPWEDCDNCKSREDQL